MIPKKKKSRILIVDSEKQQIQKIINVVVKVAKAWYIDVEFRAAHNTFDAGKMLEQEDIDLLILDTVYRGGKRGEYPGITFAERIRESSRYEFLPVIFISSVGEPERYAYLQLNCLKFLQRKFDRKELEEALVKGLQHSTVFEDDKYILLRKQGIIYPVQIKNIVYMEMKERLLYVYLTAGTVLQIPHKSLEAVNKEMGESSLFQCNRSTLVNKAYVRKINMQERYLLLKNCTDKITIGKPYMDTVKWNFRKKSGVVRVRSTRGEVNDI